jgi:hypothetical protein
LCTAPHHGRYARLALPEGVNRDDPVSGSAGARAGGRRRRRFSLPVFLGRCSFSSSWSSTSVSREPLLLSSLSLPARIMPLAASSSVPGARSSASCSRRRAACMPQRRVAEALTPSHARVLACPRPIVEQEVVPHHHRRAHQTSSGPKLPASSPSHAEVRTLSTHRCLPLDVYQLPRLASASCHRMKYEIIN